VNQRESITKKRVGKKQFVIEARVNEEKVQRYPWYRDSAEWRTWRRYTTERARDEAFESFCVKPVSRWYDFRIGETG